MKQITIQFPEHYSQEQIDAWIARSTFPAGPKYNGSLYDHSVFDKIRSWAKDRGIYTSGDPKTQTLKLMEEMGEVAKAILKSDQAEILDGIGDCVVVLTNLAHLNNLTIEECIQSAYNEIKERQGKMANGTFVKNH